MYRNKNLLIAVTALFLSILFMSCSDDVRYVSITHLSPSPKTLSIGNYLGNTQNIHPKVLYFESGWNGYIFWMAYTPYPNGKTDAENPCIAVSNDGFIWTTPGMLKNPLAFAPANGYNSDTHLVFNSDENKLECWWREVDMKKNEDYIVRKTSHNGEDWGEREVVFHEDGDMMHLSPSIFMNEGKYVMLYCNGKDIIKVSGQTDTKDAIEWGEKESLEIKWGNIIPWHLDVIADDENNMEMVVCCYERGGNNNMADLYYVKSDSQSQSFSTPQLIIRRSLYSLDIHSRSIYRSSLLKINGIYYVYFSCIDYNWRRAMSLASGENIEQLRFHDLTTPIITVN